MKEHVLFSIFKVIFFAILMFTLGAFSSIFFTSSLTIMSIIMVAATVLQVMVLILNARKKDTQINAYRKELRFKTLPFFPFTRIKWSRIADIGLTQNTVLVVLKNGKTHALKTEKASKIHSHLQQYLLA
jgi:hypothetical protein